MQERNHTLRVLVRRATPADAAACGRICYDAFATVARAHNFPCDWPSAETATEALSAVLAHPDFYGAVAETDQGVVGSCFLDERSSIAGLGPITVDPNCQGNAIGRLLMQHVLERADTQMRDGVRLVQAAYNGQSLSLYSKLGFEVREPLSVMQGPAIGTGIPGQHVRPATEADLAACNELSVRIHGYDRGRELREAVAGGTARVVEAGGRVSGYATRVGFRGHALGEGNPALQALIAAATHFTGTGFLLPSRNGELLRWCLGHGLRVVQPMTYMSRGRYREPHGTFLPSILG